MPPRSIAERSDTGDSCLARSRARSPPSEEPGAPRLFSSQKNAPSGDSTERKEKERYEGKRHTGAYGRDPFGSDVGTGHRRRWGYRRYGEHGRVRRVGVGTPPQHPLLVRETPLHPSVLLLRLQAQPLASCSPSSRWPRACSGFPFLEHSSPAVNEMLASERAYLTADWTLWKVLIALLVPLTFAALGLAFWRRSLAGDWRWSTRRSSSRSLDVSLQHRGWCPVPPAGRRARSGGLRRPDPLRHS